jgi:hypothetical protein
VKGRSSYVDGGLVSNGLFLGIAASYCWEHCCCSGTNMQQQHQTTYAAACYASALLQHLKAANAHVPSACTCAAGTAQSKVDNVTATWQENVPHHAYCHTIQQIV